jgi:hypothetical protein
MQYTWREDHFYNELGHRPEGILVDCGVIDKRISMVKCGFVVVEE